jgi:hypothetical protein
VERGLPHPNTLSIQLAPLFIGLRLTGLRGTIKEFDLEAVSTQLDKGVHQISEAEIERAIHEAGGSVSRSGLKLALTELSDGTTSLPRLRKVGPRKYVAR